MKLQDVKREGKIKNLWELARILDQILVPNRDYITGKQILPICILISKMFSFCSVCYDNIQKRHFLCYFDSMYDVEDIIASTYPAEITKKFPDVVLNDENLMAYIKDQDAWEDFAYEQNDLDFAKVEVKDYEIIETDLLLKNEKVKGYYDNIVSRIEKHLNNHKKNKFNSSGCDVFGYDKSGLDQYEYDIFGNYNGKTCKFDIIEDDSDLPFGYDGKEDIDDLFNRIFSNHYEENYDEEKDVVLYSDEDGETQYYYENRKRNNIEDDYEINLDDMESDYYEDNSPDNYDDYYEVGYAEYDE